MTREQIEQKMHEARDAKYFVVALALKACLVEKEEETFNTIIEIAIMIEKDLRQTQNNWLKHIGML